MSIRERMLRRPLLKRLARGISAQEVIKEFKDVGTVIINLREMVAEIYHEGGVDSIQINSWYTDSEIPMRVTGDVDGVRMDLSEIGRWEAALFEGNILGIGKAE